MNLLEKRRELLIAKKVPPSEYQQVEYIESNGEQYIDTGIVPSINSKLVTTVQFTVNYSGLEENHACGITTGSGRLAFGYAGKLTKSNFVAMIGGKNLDCFVAFDTNKHLFILRGDGYREVDGVGTPYVGMSFTGVYKIPIFAARASSSGISFYCSMRLFDYKLYDGETLLRDFTPCYRKSDNEIGLYDLVTKTFYTNQGTGEFLKGEEV